jgi:hypothetical protein
MFVGTAALMTVLMTWCVDTAVLLVAANTEGTYRTSVRLSFMTNFLFVLLFQNIITVVKAINNF